MGTRKLSSIFLLFLVLNLNMVIPALSYASAEETCACHISSSDHQCHHENGCKICLTHKHENHGHKATKRIAIKEQPCGNAPVHNEMALPAVSTPFLVADFRITIPMQTFSLLNPTENPLYGVTITPSEKPPQA